MKTEDNKAVENLVDKLMKETVIESPSIHFTNHVMAQVEALQANTVTQYKPLISKPIWGIIGFTMLATCIYLFLNTSANDTSWLNTLNFNALINNSTTQALSGFTISKTLTYSVGFLALMICVQVTFLKHHFDKRFES